MTGARARLLQSEYLRRDQARQNLAALPPRTLSRELCRAAKHRLAISAAGLERFVSCSQEHCAPCNGEIQLFSGHLLGVRLKSELCYGFTLVSSFRPLTMRRGLCLVPTP